MNTKSALIALSGGVDSSVAALLMQKMGYHCTGATMRLYTGQDLADDADTSALHAGAEDARAVATRLGMDFHILDAADEFREKVMDHFTACYESGLTPNPCIQCNRYMKFDYFLGKALELGCHKIVTGHYARIEFDEVSGRYLLKKAANAAKDQSYFLYTLNQHQLSHTCFPLGGMTKEEVRAIAEENGLINARKRDSQDICFVPDGDYLSFLKRFAQKEYPSGSFLDLQGKAVGTHKGAVGYTLGQRKGLGIALGAPVYVCQKNMENNTVTVGPEDALFHTSLVASDWNWIAFPTLTGPVRVKAKARSRMNEQDATVYPTDNGCAKVVFDEPQRAMTPGQAIVLYDADTVVGGGTITEIL